MHTDYFEGVLQLRSPTPEVVAFVQKEIQDHGKVKISNIEYVNGGMDLYLTDQRFIKSVGKRLHDRFLGRLKTSSRLFTRNKQTSKDVHRVTVFFQVATFRVGDTILIHGIQAIIKDIKPRVKLQDLKTGKIFFIPFDRVFKAFETVKSI